MNEVSIGDLSEIVRLEFDRDSTSSSVFYTGGKLVSNPTREGFLNRN